MTRSQRFLRIPRFPRPILYALSSTLFFLLIAAVNGNAQTKIPGKVIDPAGKPVSNMEVLLHAVGKEAGNEVDKDTTRADGSFEVDVKAVDPNLVYFVAVVYQGQLYVGDMMRAPFPLNQEYIVQVGVNPVDLSPQAAGTEVSPEEKKKDRSAGVAVVIAALAAISLIGAIVWRRRPSARRRLLVQLARLEDDLEAHPDQAASLQKRRAELRARLRAAKSA